MEASKMKKVTGLYFSPTGNTKKIVEYVAKNIGSKLQIEEELIDFTTPKMREGEYVFSENDIVAIGLPTIAGRIPNLILPFLSTIRFNGAKVIVFVTFGNRAYDDALRELADICREGKAIVIGAGAFVGEHSFSEVLGKNRPDEEDMNVCDNLLKEILAKLCSKRELGSEEAINEKIRGRSSEERQYYKPLDHQGRHIDIRKVKPKTDETCDSCMWCVLHCPLGSIDRQNPQNVSGICMKCCSCVKGCHLGSKYFDDEGFLFHKKDLEDKFATKRARSEFFV